jgi:hypothetical protein
MPAPIHTAASAIPAQNTADTLDRFIAAPRYPTHVASVHPEHPEHPEPLCNLNRIRPAEGMGLKPRDCAEVISVFLNQSSDGTARNCVDRFVSDFRN